MDWDQRDYSKIKTTKNLWMPSSEVFMQALNLKLEIAEKLPHGSKRYLITTENLFSGYMKFIIYSVQNDHSHILKLFNWAEKAFTPNNSYE